MQHRLSMGLVKCVYHMGEHENHNIQEYLELFYQTIDASFNYVLFKITWKMLKRDNTVRSSN